MTWRTAMTLRLLLFCISHTISAAYTPNNFYPALRGSSLFPPRARSRHWAPKPFAVQPRMDPTPVDAPPPIDSSDFPLLSPKDKRLMGIFRCYGWGPGCSDSSFFAPKHGGPSSSASASSLTSLSQQTRSRDDDEMQQQMVSPPFKTSSTVLQQRTSPSASGKFEPFFTLTSGGSWGPTGRKRDGGGMRRYSVAEKRLDFLKQILRDMLEEIDEDDSGGGGGGHRSLGIRRRTKRSVATYRPTPEYIRPETNFSYGVQQLQRRTARRQQQKMTVNRYS